MNVLQRSKAGNCRGTSSPRPGATAVPDYEIVDTPAETIRVHGLFFASEVVRHVDVSDHTLIIAEVSNCNYNDRAPLVFFSSRYHLGHAQPFDH